MRNQDFKLFYKIYMLCSIDVSRRGSIYSNRWKLFLSN
jgi:hypothetical protein